jgi:hypothetical protein
MAAPAAEAVAEMSYYDHDQETEEIIRESAGDLIEDAMTAIDAAWLGGLEIPIATTVAMHKLRQIVNLSVYPMDGAIPNLEVRVPDREPAPPSIDSWARGVVPTRQKVMSDDERFMSRMGGGSGTPSVSSFRSGKSGTKMSAFGSVRSRQSGEFQSRGNTADNYGDPEIFDLDDSRPSTEDGNKMNDKFEKYRRAQRRKNKNSPIVADIMEKDEFQIMQETLENGKKNFKGKKYAIDSDGKPIAISGTKPEDLPRFSMDLAANVTSFQHNDEDDIPIENKRSDSVDNKKAGGKKVRIAGSRTMEESYFIPSKTLATALSETGTEKFDLKAGVSIKAGDVLLEGPIIPSDPKRMSRKEFLEKKRNAALTDGSSVTSTLHTGGPVPDGLDAGNSLGSLDSETMGMSRTSRLTDVDALEGGKKKVQSNALVRPVTDRELGLGPVQTSTRPQEGKVPKKASAKQHEIMKDFNGGTDKSGPRDRLPPSISVPTSKMKKLPPPGSGKTIGHGLGDNSSTRSGSKSPNKNSNYDNSSFGGDNSTIHTASVMSQKKEKGIVKLANAEIARELY